MPELGNQVENVRSISHLFGPIPRKTLVYSSSSILAFIVLIIVIAREVKFPQFFETRMSVYAGKVDANNNRIASKAMSDSQFHEIINQEILFLTSHQQQLERVKAVSPTTVQQMEPLIIATQKHIIDLRERLVKEPIVSLTNEPNRNGRITITFSLPQEKAPNVDDQTILNLISTGQLPIEVTNPKVVGLEQQHSNGMAHFKLICQVKDLKDTWDQKQTTFQIAIPYEELSIKDLIVRKFSQIFFKDGLVEEGATPDPSH